MAFGDFLGKLPTRFPASVLALQQHFGRNRL
jgi:hypothetical protein